MYKECFSQIAVLNLKKSGGNSESVYEEIASYAEADREEIIKEFELIDADIIVCGYTFGILMDNYDRYDNVSHFRIDKMTEVKELDGVY